MIFFLSYKRQFLTPNEVVWDISHEKVHDVFNRAKLGFIGEALNFVLFTDHVMIRRGRRIRRLRLYTSTPNTSRRSPHGNLNAHFSWCQLEADTGSVTIISRTRRGPTFIVETCGCTRVGLGLVGP